MVLALTVTACEEPQVYSTDYVDKLEARITELENLVGVISSEDDTPVTQPNNQMINNNFSSLLTEIQEMKEVIAKLEHHRLYGTHGGGGGSSKNQQHEHSIQPAFDGHSHNIWIR